MTGLYFDGDPLLRYSRRLRLPARSRRTTWFPVRPPQSIAEVKVHPFLYEAEDVSRSILRNERDQFLEPDVLPRVDPPMTILVGNPAAENVGGPDSVA